MFLDREVPKALALEVEEAEPVGTLGFMARFLIQITMPDSKSDMPYFQRRLRLVQRKEMARTANLKPSAPAARRKLHIVHSQSRFGKQASIPPHPPQDRVALIAAQIPTLLIPQAAAGIPRAGHKAAWCGCRHGSPFMLGFGQRAVAFVKKEGFRDGMNQHGVVSPNPRKFRVAKQSLFAP